MTCKAIRIGATGGGLRVLAGLVELEGSSESGVTRTGFANG